MSHEPLLAKTLERMRDHLEVLLSSSKELMTETNAPCVQSLLDLLQKLDHLGIEERSKSRRIFGPVSRTFPRCVSREGRHGHRCWILGAGGALLRRLRQPRAARRAPQHLGCPDSCWRSSSV